MDPAQTRTPPPEQLPHRPAPQTDQEISKAADAKSKAVLIRRLKRALAGEPPDNTRRRPPMSGTSGDPAVMMIIEENAPWHWKNYRPKSTCW